MKLPSPTALIVTLALGLLAAPRGAGARQDLDFPPADGADTFRSQLESALRDERELRPLYERWLPELGLDTILDIIEERPCHGQGHDLGKVVFATLGSVGEAIRQCSDRCTSGCLHGVLMEVFQTDRHASIRRDGDRAMEICFEEEVRAEVDRGTCIHGVGHALFVLTNGNATAAVDRCTRFADPAHRYFCASGVYMQNMMDHREEWATGPITTPCADEELYPAACYRYRLRGLVREIYTSRGDPQKLAEQCLDLPPRHRIGCFHGFGDAVRPLVMATPSSLGRYCALGDAADRRACIDGAVDKLSDLDQDRAAAACVLLTDRAEREHCDRVARLGLYDPDKDYSLYLPPADAPP